MLIERRKSVFLLRSDRHHRSKETPCFSKTKIKRKRQIQDPFLVFQKLNMNRTLNLAFSFFQIFHLSVRKVGHLLFVTLTQPVETARVYKRAKNARPCGFLVSMLRSRHSKRPTRTGKNEASKRKKERSSYCNQFIAFENRGKQLHFLTPKKNGC
ncbi:hypothetical protein AAH986_12095 [Enterococcus lactis]